MSNDEGSEPTLEEIEQDAAEQADEVSEAYLETQGYIEEVKEAIIDAEIKKAEFEKSIEEAGVNKESALQGKLDLQAALEAARAEKDKVVAAKDQYTPESYDSYMSNWRKYRGEVEAAISGYDTYISVITEWIEKDSVIGLLEYEDYLKEIARPAQEDAYESLKSMETWLVNYGEWKQGFELHKTQVGILEELDVLDIVEKTDEGYTLLKNTESLTYSEIDLLISAGFDVQRFEPPQTFTGRKYTGYSYTGKREFQDGIAHYLYERKDVGSSQWMPKTQIDSIIWVVPSEFAGQDYTGISRTVGGKLKYQFTGGDLPTRFLTKEKIMGVPSVKKKKKKKLTASQQADIDRLGQQHSALIEEASDAREEGKKTKAKKLTEQIKELEEEMSKKSKAYKEGKPVSAADEVLIYADVTLFQPSDITIDELITESHVKGLDASIAEQLKLWGEGLITQEVFVERRTMLEEAHLEWAEKAEERDWKASEEERAQVEELLTDVFQTQTIDLAAQVLAAEVEGLITHEQSLAFIQQIESEQLRFAKLAEQGEIAVPEGFDLVLKYTISEPGQIASTELVDNVLDMPISERHPDVEGYMSGQIIQPMPEIEVTPDTIVEVPGSLLAAPTTIPDPSDFTGIPGPAAGPAPGSIGEMVQETIQDILDVEVTAIPGPAAGPAPGSVGELIQGKIEYLFEVEETFFKELTKPFVLASEEQAKYALEFALQGKAVEGTLAYAASLLLGSVPVAFDVMTTPVRPGLVAESLGSMFELALDWDPEAERQAAELRKKIETQDLLFSMYKSDIIVLEQEFLKEQRKADILFSDPSKYTPESFKAFEEDWARYESETLESLAKAETGKMEYTAWKAEAESQLLYLEGYSPREAVIESVLSDPVRALVYVGTGIAAGYVTGKLLGEVVTRGKKAIFDWEMGRYTEADWFPVETEMGMQYPHTEIKQPDWWRKKKIDVLVEDTTSHPMFEGLGIDDAAKWGDDLNPPWGTTEGGPTLMPKGVHRGLPWEPSEILGKYRQTGEGPQLVDYIDPRYAVKETWETLIREPSPFSVPVTTPGISFNFDISSLQLAPSAGAGLAGGLLGGVEALLGLDEKLAPITPEVPSISPSIDLDSLATITQVLKVEDIGAEAKLDLEVSFGVNLFADSVLFEDLLTQAEKLKTVEEVKKRRKTVEVVLPGLDVVQREILELEKPISISDLIQLQELDQISLIEQKTVIDLDLIQIQVMDLDQIQLIEQAQIPDIDQVQTQITEPIQIQDIEQAQLQIPDLTQIQITEPVQITAPIPIILITPDPPSLGLPFFFPGETRPSKGRGRGRGISIEDWTWPIPDIDLGGPSIDVGGAFKIKFTGLDLGDSSELDLDELFYGKSKRKTKRKRRKK